MELDDWQALVNKPVFTSDGKDVGVVSQIQPEKIIVTYGPITPDKYVIRKSSVRNIEHGVVYLSETGSFIGITTSTNESDQRIVSFTLAVNYIRGMNSEF